jgi:hypothetical protein
MRPEQEAPSHGRRLRRGCASRLFGLAACLLGVGACQRDDVTTLKHRGDTTSQGTPAAARDESSGLGSRLEDRARHLGTSLTNRAAAAKLRGHLRDLAAHLEAGDEPKARRALALARQALSRAGVADASKSANDSAVRLVLDHAEALLNEATPPREPPGSDPDTTDTISANTANQA